MTESSTLNVHSTKWNDIDLMKFCSLVALASTTENTIFYPFYVIKTREQHDRRNLSFWQSCSIPIYGLYLGVYVGCKDQLSISKNDQFVKLYAPFISGCVSDAVCILLYVPSDVIVQRLQLLNSPYKSAFDGIRQIYRTDGLRGYYRGLGATYLFTSTYSATWWTVYENAKTLFYSPKVFSYLTLSSQSNDEKITVNRFPQFLAGYTAGTITAIFMNPIDVVKTRVQTEDFQSKLTVPYQNVFHGLKRLIWEEGFRGLSKGLIPKLLSRGLLSGLSAFLFEIVLFYSKKDFLE